MAVHPCNPGNAETETACTNDLEQAHRYLLDRCQTSADLT
jgi:hypothetical protein